ncbi:MULTISPECIES: hypothetical protein [unclassified Paraburkholderia]|uniref:hypothetical protein n=1 Tax=unclassified Paraburkholderia TaxID=2615204 RepID=UPI000E27ABA8|nr:MULTISPECIES: hypothetical protein [unclassified Paraburkholderia]REE20883.1 hypothetical protein B0G71_4022 [Paraburkholderia sp. BL27I4N3]RKR43764.1 hypothetical protein B0G82_1342 [Paraburkholderia sp. BL17N1]
MIPREPRAIGGYFELELPRAGATLHDDALRFQSSRAAFLALLRAVRPTAVWMPWYICDAMIEPLRMTGTPFKRYRLDAELRVQPVDIAQGEWLVYVNYFGLCAQQVDDVLSRFPRERVVIDNAQALFARSADCLATLYSPRKFLGVPDGGYLVTRQPIAMPEAVDDASLLRSGYLLTRLAKDAEAGYSDYAAAEESLKHQEPLRMSALTQRLLAGVDYESVRARRAENFAYLHDKLQRYNRFTFRYDEDAAPLCYPFFGAPPGMREVLRAQRIYTPTYWPDIATAAGAPDFERRLPESTLCLPCDQRLTHSDLAPMVQHLLDRLA